ncbi:hypothetical protein HDF16_002273 [Granulicella aggregans]|uniref:HicA-like toxin of HicAB toxin-antitoxin system n=2 Tax=Granulicella aggregans TaxID=474949 RepID=A0A7W7ZD26_9BACT|nr:hypothetical protein [Granulicella aggregans]
MTGLSFDLVKAGGSGRKFIHPITGGTLFLHQPHPANVLKAYQVRDAIELLKREGFL